MQSAFDYRPEYGIGLQFGSLDSHFIHRHFDGVRSPVLFSPHSFAVQSDVHPLVSHKWSVISTKGECG